MSTFPVFDLSKFTNASPSEKKSLGRQVDEICRQTGFLAITGHGIPDETITRAWNSARAFFDLPIEKKLAVKMRYEGYPYGYSPLQSEALAKSKGEDTPPDIKETFNIGPLAVPPHSGNEPFADFRYATNIWPPEPAEFEQAWSDYSRALGTLAGKIMQVFAVTLSLPENFFDAAVNDPISAVRALNYPHQNVAPQPGPPTTPASQPPAPTPPPAASKSSTPKNNGNQSPPSPTVSSSTSATSWPAGPTIAGSPPCI